VTDLPFDLLRSNSAAMASRLRILGHPERLLMLCRMAGGEVTVSELIELTGLSQSAVSQHLSKFRDCGLVTVRRAGSARHYRLDDDHIRVILGTLCEFCEPGGGVLDEPDCEIE
jgi:DNA-binding transcriptional ArsR family regulator